MPTTVGNCVNGWCLIPAGGFWMGSPATTDPDAAADEKPRHYVNITRPFFIEETEVTQGEWKAVMGYNPSHFKSCGDYCPVEQVSWLDALVYANKRSINEGFERCYTLRRCTGSSENGDLSCESVDFVGLACKGYRLPTEAEWEYAARAKTSTIRYHSDIDAIAWYNGNSNMKTHRVATLAPNNWGLYDVLGNVFEWVWDRYGETYYQSCEFECTDPTGPSSEWRRVYRGGACSRGAGEVRAAFRIKHAWDFSNWNLGLRLVRTKQ